MKPDWLRTLPVACMTALGLALLAGTPPARADGAAEFSAWSSAASGEKIERTACCRTSEIPKVARSVSNGRP